MRVLITRPGDDSALLADTLRQAGIESVPEPLLTIRFLDGPPLDLAGIQAILLTSANGARAIASRTERRDLPVFAVGDATARTAREVGFAEVQSASGDVEALATLVRERFQPEKGSLLHGAASEVAGDLGGRLGEAGFTVRREVLYEAEPAHSLTPTAVAAIKEGRIDAVMVFSPRTADTLARLIRKARLVRDCRTITLYCLSKAVAEASGDIPWKAVKIAEQPTQDAMIAMAVRDAAPGASTENRVPAANAAPPSRASHPVRTVALTVLVILALAGLAAVTESLWRPEVARYVPWLAFDEDVAQAKIDELTRRLAALESKTAAPTPSGPDVAALEADRAQLQARLSEALARLEKVESELQSVRSSMAQATQAGGAGGDDPALRQALKTIGERLADLERARAGGDADAAARIDRLARQVDEIEKTASRGDADMVRQARLVFAIGRLRDAVQSGRAFAIELAALKALAGDDPATQQTLQRLDRYADSGVPSLDALRQRFRTLARDTVNATRVPEGDGWLERSLARVMRAVSIRRTDDLEGADVESVIARAEAALGRGDVRQTIAELQQLPETVRPLAKAWIADAEALVAGTRALVDLQTQAFAALGVPAAAR